MSHHLNKQYSYSHYLKIFTLVTALSGAWGLLSFNLIYLGDLISGTCYIGGIISGIKSALFLKEHYESPPKTGLSAPILYALVAGCLLFIPALLMTAGDSSLPYGSEQHLSYLPQLMSDGTLAHQ